MVKKRGAPQKECVGCGQTIHAATKVCKHCGAEQPSKAPVRAASARKGGGQTARSSSKGEFPMLKALDHAVALVKEVNGDYERAKYLIDTVQAIRED